MDPSHATPADREHFGPNSREIRTFLERLEALEFEELGQAIRIWRDELSDGWHDADRAVATAIRDTGRHQAQEAVLEALYDVFRRAPWFTGRQPGTRIASSDATAQYVATSALLALLVCDRVPPEHLQTLYRPFAGVIPMHELGARGGAAARADARDDRVARG